MKTGLKSELLTEVGLYQSHMLKLWMLDLTFSSDNEL